MPVGTMKPEQASRLFLVHHLSEVSAIINCLLHTGMCQLPTPLEYEQSLSYSLNLPI